MSAQQGYETEDFTDIETALAERYGAVGGVDPDVVVGSGRRRAGRRMAAVVGGGVVAGVAVVGAGLMGAGALGDRDEPVVPAASTRASFEGCTLEPSTCDARIIDRWLADGGMHPVPSKDVRLSPEDDQELGEMAPGGYSFATLVSGEEQSEGGTASVDGVVARSVDEEFFAKRVGGEERGVDVRTVVVPVGGTTVEATVSTLNNEGHWFQGWIVPEGSGHGAVVLSYEGSRPRGGEPALGVDAVDDRITGWTDSSVSELIAQLLTEPPADPGD